MANQMLTHEVVQSMGAGQICPNGIGGSCDLEILSMDKIKTSSVILRLTAICD